MQALGKPVSSQYCTRLFLQHPDQAGHVYNVRQKNGFSCMAMKVQWYVILQLVKADEVRLQELEVRLVGVVDGLKQRLKWLNSGRSDKGVLLYILLV